MTSDETQARSLAAFCAELRDAVRALVAACAREPRLAARVADEAYEVERLLTQDTGRITEALWANMIEINRVAYDLADYLTPVFYGVARSPSGVILSAEGARDALQALRELTAENNRLEALREVP